MKKSLFLVMLSLVWLSGCKKDEDVIDPNFAASVSGRYPLTFFREGSQSINLPVNGISGYLETTRIDNTHINMKLSLTVGPDAADTSVDDLGSVELLSDSGNRGTFNLRAAQFGYNVGTISATDVTIRDTATDGTEIEIRGKR